MCGRKEEKFDGATGKRPKSCSGAGHGPPAGISTVLEEVKLNCGLEWKPHGADTVL